MNECCTSKETRNFYNNIAYHLSKEVIEKKMDKFHRSPQVVDFLNEFILAFDEVFPSEDNQWNYLFEEKMAELGFFYEEDKEKIKEIKKIYQKKADKSREDRAKFKREDSP